MECKEISNICTVTILLIVSHKEIHNKLTWRSADGKTVKQIDHVMVNKCIRTSILDTRAMRVVLTITLRTRNISESWLGLKRLEESKYCKV